MRFGAFLPTYWDDYRSTPIHVAINGAALAAEALGYEGVWASDQMISLAAPRHDGNRPVSDCCMPAKPPFVDPHQGQLPKTAGLTRWLLPG
jgi:hypothetical protein